MNRDHPRVPTPVERSALAVSAWGLLTSRTCEFLAKYRHLHHRAILTYYQFGIIHRECLTGNGAGGSFRNAAFSLAPRVADEAFTPERSRKTASGVCYRKTGCYP